MFKQERLLLACVMTAGCVGVWTASARAQDATSARQFVESVYRQYEHDGDGIGLTGPRAAQFYHSSLIALASSDEKAVGEDTTRAVDWDPICGCNDWEGIWDLHTDLRMEGPVRATANISFAISAPEHRSTDDVIRLVMTLTIENGQWRIWDIRDVSDPKTPIDVRTALTREVAKLAKRPRTLSQ